MSGDKTITLSVISPKLTESVLTQFLKDAFGNDTQMKHYSIESGSAKGDSYLSTVFRIKVEGSSTDDSNSENVFLPLIVKSLPKSLCRRKTFRSEEFFRNEVAFYNQVVPQLLAFQERQKPEHPFTEFPKCFLAIADGENDIVVMEDMSYKMYRTASRLDGLNYQQLECILKVLARFHALSLAMKDKEPEAFQRVSSSLYETYYKPETKSWYFEQLQLFISIAHDAVTKELPESCYAEKFLHFANNSLFEKLCELVKPKEPYAVIGHGDAWAPNFLLKYFTSDLCDIESVCMIDYQLARYASPILDISFFLYSCASREIMFSNFKDLLDLYHRNLSEFLDDLGSSAEKVFPYKNFQEEVNNFFCFGLAMSLESVPLSTLDDNDSPDVESLVGDEAIPLTKIWALKPIKDKAGRIRLAYNIKHAIDNSFIS